MLFCILRNKLFKKYLYIFSRFTIVRISLFLKIFRIFIFKIKSIFLTNIIYVTLEKTKKNNFFSSFYTRKKDFISLKKQIKTFFEHLIVRKNNVIFTISFLNYFVFCDIIKRVLQNKISTRSIFTIFIKYFLNWNKKHLFFRFAWFFTDLYLSSFEMYLKTLKNFFNFKSFSYWKREDRVQLYSYFLYLYGSKRFKFLYIRCYTRAPNPLMLF